MEKRITSLLLANNPGNELVRRVKELDDKIKWLQHNSRNMDNYLELEPFSKDSELCGYVCDTLKALPEVPTIATCKDYKAIVILLGISTTHYQILDELAEQHNPEETGGPAPPQGRYTRTAGVLRCAALDATGAAIPVQRI